VKGQKLKGQKTEVEADGVLCLILMITYTPTLLLLCWTSRVSYKALVYIL